MQTTTFKDQQHIFFSDSKKDIRNLSSLTKTKLKVENSKVYVKEISPDFYALFAKQKINKGELIIDYAGEVIHERQLNLILKKSPQIADEISSYLVESSEENKLIRSDRYTKEFCNFARFSNYNASGPNALILANKTGAYPCLRALHTIPAHWQILLNYGDTYKLNFPIIPLNPAPADYGLQLAYSSYTVTFNLNPDQQRVFGLTPIKNETFVTVKIPKFLKKAKGSKLNYVTAHLPILQLTQRNPVIFDNSAKITPLMWACFQGQLSKIKLLIKSGVDVNSLSHNGKNALLFLILGKGDPEKCNELIKEFENRKMIFNNIFEERFNILNFAIIAAESKIEKIVYVKNIVENYYCKIVDENQNYHNIIWFCLSQQCFSSLATLLINLPPALVKISLADEALRETLLKQCIDNPGKEYVAVVKSLFTKYHHKEKSLEDFKKPELHLLSLTGELPAKKLKRKRDKQAASTILMNKGAKRINHLFN